MTRARVPADLSNLELFAGCDDRDLVELASRLSTVRAARGETLVRQGEVARWFVIVVEGEAVVTRDDGDGEHEVGMVAPGSIIGELSVLRAAPRSATVTATRQLHGYIGDVHAFSVLLGVPGVAARITRTARQRLAANTHPVGVSLRDGTRVSLRPMLPTDRHKLADAQPGFSRESHYRRFFTPPPLNDAIIRYLVDVDYVSHFAWAALAADDPGVPGIASARYIREREAPDTAEVALSVIDEYQGRGLGGLLIGALACAAEVNGVRRFRARVLAENSPMLGILRHGNAHLRSVEPGVLETVVDVPPFAQGLPDAATAAALRDTARSIVAAADLALSS